MIESRDKEKCHYCNDAAEYSQLVGNEADGYFMSVVCAKHVVMDLTS